MQWQQVSLEKPSPGAPSPYGPGAGYGAPGFGGPAAAGYGPGAPGGPAFGGMPGGQAVTAPGFGPPPGDPAGAGSPVPPPPQAPVESNPGLGGYAYPGYAGYPGQGGYPPQTLPAGPAGFAGPPGPGGPGYPGYPGYPGAGGHPGYGYGWPGMPLPQNGLGTAALVLGILSICLFFLYGVVSLVLGTLAVIFGVKGRRRAARGEATNAGQAQGGFVTGIIGIVVGIAMMVLFGFVISKADDNSTCDDEDGYGYSTSLSVGQTVGRC